MKEIWRCIKVSQQFPGEDSALLLVDSPALKRIHEAVVERRGDMQVLLEREHSLRRMPPEHPATGTPRRFYTQRVALSSQAVNVSPFLPRCRDHHRRPWLRVATLEARCTTVAGLPADTAMPATTIIAPVPIILEILSGVAAFTRAELQRHLPASRVLAVRDTELELEGADLDDVRQLRTVVAAYLTLDFPIRKPRGLLSSDRLKAVTAAFDEIRRQRPRQRFSSMRFSVAGAHTPEMSRFRAALSAALNLPEEPESGDLLVRVRQHPDTAAVWQVLLRTTPRPLSARPWRVVNYPGAVNATIAAAVVDALDPRPDDEVVDLMCGSGTLVLERLARCGIRRMVACDISPVAIDAAMRNQRAARLKGAVEYRLADFRSLERGDSGFGTLMANPPWGELVGSHQENDVLYADLLDTAHRLAASGARFGVLTHDIKRFEAILRGNPHWSCSSVTRFFQKGHHPRLYVLQHLTIPFGEAEESRPLR